MVNYLPNWGIAVWNQPAGQPTGKYLKTGTQHMIIGYALHGTQIWARTSENEWLDVNYLI